MGEQDGGDRSSRTGNPETTETHVFRFEHRLQFDAKPEKPDALFAAKIQELIGGAFGEMTVAMQYLFQGFGCRVEGKYKDMIMDIGAEELAHVEMLSVMVARLLEGAPTETTASAAAANPALAAILGGSNPQHAIVAGGTARPADSMGNPWSGAYIVASGNLLADFRTNAAYESQGRLQATRVYEMTDDPGIKKMLAFNIARDTMHQNQWLAAIEELLADGVEDVPVPSAFPTDQQNSEHAYTYWHLSDGEAAAEGRWASGPAPDGKGEFTYLADPPRSSDDGSLPPGDPLLYGSGPTGDSGKTATQGVVGKVKDALG